MFDHEDTTAHAMGIENPKELLKTCLEISLTTKTCSEILNKLICSHLTTKELVYCAFLCGRMQEMDIEKAIENFINQIIENKINQSK
jgi:hypothetical protein